MASSMMRTGEGDGGGAGRFFAPHKTIDTYADTGRAGTIVRFDPCEELLWLGSNEGDLLGYQGSYLTPYAAFNTQQHYRGGVGAGTLTDFCLTDAGPFVVSSNGITQHKRDGMMLFNPMISNTAYLNCCLSVNSHSTVIVAGNKGTAAKLDISRPNHVEHLQIGDDLDVVLVRASDRFLCLGSARGELGILDLRSNQLRRHWLSDTRHLMLYDFDVHDYSLFACAYEVDASGAIPSSCSVSAYDLRVCKPTAPITAALSPTLLRFLPGSCGQKFVVADDRGRYQMLDSVATSGKMAEIFEVEGRMAGDVFACSMDVSSSGQGIGIADTAGVVCVLSTTAASEKHTAVWNVFSRPSAGIEVIHQVPVGTGGSDMLFQPVQRFSSSAAGTIAATADATVPYNRKALTSAVGFPPKSPSAKPISRKQQTPTGAIPRSISYVEYSPSRPKISETYRPTNVKMSSSDWEDVAEPLPLAVLEPISLYSHINPVLQALFSMKSISAFFQSHVCFDEFCLTCELGFVFHMLSVEGSEDSCQATNLVRVLRSLPESSERGLLATSSSGHEDDLGIGIAVQNWVEFLLERTHYEYLHHTGYHESQESPVTQLCAWKVLETVMHACGHTNQLEKFVFCLPLVYSIPRDRSRQDFRSVLESSLNEHSEWPLTCAYCHQQTNSYVSRNVLTSPESFTVSFNLHDVTNKAALKHLADSWKIRRTVSREKSKSPLTSEVKPCRYGASCTRPNCFFLHPSEVEEDQALDDSSTFIPPYIWTRVDVNGHMEVASHEPVDSYAWMCYEAATFVFETTNTCGKEEPRTLACAVKQRGSSSSSSAMTEPVWQIFQDVDVAATTQNPALTFDLTSKMPCIVQYARVDMELRWPVRVMNPINRDIFQKFCDLTASRRSYQKNSVVPVQRQEVFSGESIVALDAEFVSLAGDNVDLAMAVAASSAKPSLLSVGRVTVVRGNGSLTNTLLMDEYVVARDKIANHLTEFSGIRPGDLSANLSLKRLDTLKSVYVRLRYLVDSGVHFVGHGIHTDFRILNIRVPASQIVDTVQLYRMPEQRLISLKFLAWYFLGNHIQHLHGHDSAEDAETSLQLYNLFEKYRILASYADSRHHPSFRHSGPAVVGSACTFVDLLAQMYELGRSLQWKVPPPHNP